MWFTLLHYLVNIPVSCLFVVVLVHTRSIHRSDLDAAKPIAAYQHDMHLTSRLRALVADRKQ